MDHELKDRRLEGRFVPPTRGHVRATLRPGCGIVLVDVSESGALIEAPRPLRPGARVHLQVVTTTRRFAMAANVLRCVVWSLDSEDGAMYRGALRFDQRVDWGWAEATRRVQVVPEHTGPKGTREGKRIPGATDERVVHRA
ncbi:MAG: PilZ domain-containing protein [Acidobacteria bacterium]|nr:PilZ domain-containing protein [Acidobacteriota bacterium]